MYALANNGKDYIYPVLYRIRTGGGSHHQAIYCLGWRWSHLWPVNGLVNFRRLRLPRDFAQAVEEVNVELFIGYAIRVSISPRSVSIYVRSKCVRLGGNRQDK